MTFLSELRDAMRTTANTERCFALAAAEDELAEALQALNWNPIASNMVWVNGAWAKAFQLLEKEKDERMYVVEKT